MYWKWLAVFFLNLNILGAPVLSYAQDKQKNVGFYDSLWVRPDGQMALFMFSRYNFFPTILRGDKPELSQNILPGHHVNDINPWADSDLYFSYRLKNGRWSDPINMPTNDDQADCCGMIAGQELFFQKGADIYHALFEEGRWGAASKLPMNTDFIETNPHYDIETQTLYWATNRGGNFDIWEAKRDENTGEWYQIMPVVGDVNSPEKEDQPFVQGREMRFSRAGASGNLVAHFRGGVWRDIKIEKLGTDLYHAEISLSHDGKTAWFVGGDSKMQEMRFMRSILSENGDWQEAAQMGLISAKD